MRLIKPSNSNNNETMDDEILMTLQGKITRVVIEGKKPNRGSEESVITFIQI